MVRTGGSWIICASLSQLRVSCIGARPTGHAVFRLDENESGMAVAVGARVSEIAVVAAVHRMEIAL
jgi:hypothetical protein